jgi:hypothetical protein
MGLAYLDLRELPASSYRVKGTVYTVPDHERQGVGGLEYFLIREPDNKFDKSAVAIHSGINKVGYVSSSKAGGIAPLLDRLGNLAFLVNGANTTETSLRLWIDLPTLPARRAYVTETVPKLE